MPENKTIMIIEDDVNLLYGLQAKLRIEGYKIIADEGLSQTESLEKIRALRPDYLILDIILPKINGFDLLAEIKADAAVCRIPVFIFTNLSDRESRQKSKELGADFYLIKSEFNLDEFVAKFKKIVANREKIA